MSVSICASCSKPSFYDGLCIDHYGDLCEQDLKEMAQVNYKCFRCNKPCNKTLFCDRCNDGRQEDLYECLVK